MVLVRFSAVPTIVFMTVLVVRIPLSWTPLVILGRVVSVRLTVVSRVLLLDMIVRL